MKFNKWSKDRLALGKKRLTSRNKPSPEDPIVDYVVALPWEFIRDFLWRDEGADSPEELQRVMNRIQRKKVPDEQLFYVHVLKKEWCELQWI